MKVGGVSLVTALAASCAARSTASKLGCPHTSMLRLRSVNLGHSNRLRREGGVRPAAVITSAVARTQRRRPGR